MLTGHPMVLYTLSIAFMFSALSAGFALMATNHMRMAMCALATPAVFSISVLLGFAISEGAV